MLISFIISFIIFFAFVGAFEYWKYRKRQAREESAVYLNVKGKITDSQIINKPYYVGMSRGSTSVRSFFMLIFTVEDDNGEKSKVKVAGSSTYEGVDNHTYWNREKWIGVEVIWKVKKYPEADIYVFEEGTYQVSSEEKSFFENARNKREI